MQTAAILAGGRARRLGGRDKSRLVIGGRTILERQLDVLRSLVPRIVIVANAPEQFTDAGVAVLADALPGCGSLGGIYTALAAPGARPDPPATCRLSRRRSWPADRSRAEADIVSRRARRLPAAARTTASWCRTSDAPRAFPVVDRWPTSERTGFDEIAPFDPDGCCCSTSTPRTT
jgi:hypothetical protein